MGRTIAIFGAGTGLGAATARRFGKEGYTVVLVARRPERLDALVAELGQESIEATAFPADLAETAAVPALVERIMDRFGRIDVVEYAPIPTAAPMAAATQVTAELLGRLAGLYLHTPVETARAVLPGMIERGEGAFLLGQGVSAVHPLPGMSGVGPVMAAARNWILSLHGELAAHGVYAGTLSVAAWIEGSAGHRAASEADAALGATPRSRRPNWPISTGTCTPDGTIRSGCTRPCPRSDVVLRDGPRPPCGPVTGRTPGWPAHHPRGGMGGPPGCAVRRRPAAAASTGGRISGSARPDRPTRQK